MKTMYEAQRDAEDAARGCNCDQSLSLTKRLDLALEALDAIRLVCANLEPGDTPGAYSAMSFIGSIVSLAGANLERVKP